MEKLEKFVDKYWFLIIVVLTMPSVWALLVPGFYGASDDLHIAWLYEMNRAFLSGQIPPRFVPDLSFGFGYPLFNFAFPFPYYIGEIFHTLGFSFVDSIKIIFATSLVFSGVAMFKLLRFLTTPILSLAGALVYIFTPYRSNDVYNRGDLGESLSFVFLPVIILAFLKLSNDQINLKDRAKWIAVGGLSLGGLILTHDITAYMFFPGVILLSLLMVIFCSGNKLKSFINLLLATKLGLLISLYFWLPALMDRSLMKQGNVFNFIDHFPTLSQLVTPYWGYGASVPGPGDGMSFFIGIINWILLILGGVLSVILWKKLTKLKRVVLIWSMLVFITAFFMMNFRSVFLWDRLPLLPYFQFPWRFLILTTFLTPIFVICLENIKHSKLIAIVILVSVLGINWSFFRPHDFLGRVDSYYINRYIPVPKASSDYTMAGEESVIIPVDTSVRPDKNYPVVYPQELVQNLRVINPMSVVFNTSSGSTLDLNYSKYYFPGWKVMIDGKAVAIVPGQPFGQINFQVPAGNHSVRILYQETTPKLIMDLVSLLSLIFGLLLLFPKISTRVLRLIEVSSIK